MIYEIFLLIICILILITCEKKMKKGVCLCLSNIFKIAVTLIIILAILSIFFKIHVGVITLELLICVAIFSAPFFTKTYKEKAPIYIFTILSIGFIIYFIVTAPKEYSFISPNKNTNLVIRENTNYFTEYKFYKRAFIFRKELNYKLSQSPKAADFYSKYNLTWVDDYEVNFAIKREAYGMYKWDDNNSSYDLTNTPEGNKFLKEDKWIVNIKLSN
jgi:phage shock protein PspC (stress-responsive transcriptional regulator)